MEDKARRSPSFLNPSPLRLSVIAGTLDCDVSLMMLRYSQIDSVESGCDFMYRDRKQTSRPTTGPPSHLY
jgi:hypothetical protein